MATLLIVLPLSSLSTIEMRIAPLEVREVSNCTNPANENASEALYELEVAHPLPTFDLSKTFVSKLLPSKTHDRLLVLMHPKLNSFLVGLFRLSLLCFGCLLFAPVKILSPLVPFMVAAIVLPPVIFVTFFSLDLLVLLATHYEFWFISVLNTLNWVGLGLIFGDIRAVSCVGLWLSSQSVVLIDSNYRTFPTAVKSIIISGPFLILLVVCCSYSLIADASFSAINVGKFTVQWRQVVVFTASTLSVFVVKKAYTKNRRLRFRLRDRQADPEAAQGVHTIPCVGLHARLKLSRLKVRRTQFSVSTIGNLVESQTNRPTQELDMVAASNRQKLTLAPHDPIVVDARNVVLRGYLLRWMEAPYLQSLLYVTGVIGLSSTAISWIMILYHHEENTRNQLQTGVTTLAVVCSLVFTVLLLSLAQRDLLRLSVWSFDVLFSTFQGTALAVLLLDLLQCRAVLCLSVFAWWLWFHCLLVLDALTPSLTHQLPIRKHFGLPAVIVVLSVATGCAMELIIGGGDVFQSRLLWSVRVTSTTGFDLHTSTLAIQRTITIVGWFPRLLLELATGSPDQLLFIRRQVEYFSPHATFSDPVPRTIVEVETPTRLKIWRRSPSNISASASEIQSVQT